MNDKVISSWLDIAPAYLNFAIRFLRRTRTAFAEHAKAGKVSPDLTSILVGGIALSYLIAIVAAPPQLKQDRSSLVQWLGHLDYYLLPLMGLFAALVLGVTTHLLGKLYAGFSRAFDRTAPGPWDPRLGGTLEDSVNAALGFAAVFLPVATAALCIAARLPQTTWISAATSILLVAFVVAYFPLSLASTHPDTGYRQALMATSGAVLLPLLAGNIVTWISNLVTWISNAV